MSNTHRVSLHAQISEVQNEMTMRKQVYAGLVSRGKMRRSEADLKIQYMEAALTSLQWLSRNQDDIKALLAERAKAKGEQG